MWPGALSFNVNEQINWWLLPEKGIYWPEQEMLILADVHLGKASHFRKSGVPVPADLEWAAFQQLFHLVDRLHVRNLLILGDLFHSEHNEAWEELKLALKQRPSLNCTLVEGNHDRFITRFLENSGVHSVGAQLEMGRLLFSHEPLTAVQAGSLNIAGHIHPAVVMKGRGKQHLRLPAFIKTEQLLLLPAFGDFTGAATQKITGQEQVFVVAGDKVISL